MAKSNPGADATGHVVQLGDEVMVAKTGSQRGISWRRGKVVRLTDKSLWLASVARYDMPYLTPPVHVGDPIEDGPHKLANTIAIGGSIND